MRILYSLLLSILMVSPVAAQTGDPPPPDHAEIVEQVRGVNDYVGQVNGEVKKALTQLEALTTQLSTLAGQQTLLMQEVTTLKSQVTAVSTAVSAVDGKATTLDGKVAALDTKVTGLEGDMLALPIEIAAEGVGSQMLTMRLKVQGASGTKQQYAAFLPGDFSKSIEGPQGYNNFTDAFGIPFPAGRLDMFSFTTVGRAARATCDVTLTVQDDGVATALSGTITDHDGNERDVYMDPDAVDIEAGSVINLSIEYSGGCGGSSSSPDHLFISMNFTPAAVAETTD